jgi:hypothetical protein
MRMKEPATTKGRILKCPMCRVPENVPGKRSSLSYEYELDQLYRSPVPVPAPVPRSVPVPAPRPVPRSVPRPVPRPVPVAVPRGHTDDWAAVADRVRLLPTNIQHRHIWMYPQLAPYFENYTPHRVIPVPTQAFCQGGRRETGECHTRSKTKRKCTYVGCNKFVCRSCRQCLTH